MSLAQSFPLSNYHSDYSATLSFSSTLNSDTFSLKLGRLEAQYQGDMYPVFQQDTEEQPLGGANTIRKAWSGAAPSRVYAFQPAAAIRCTNVLTKCNIVVYPFCVEVEKLPSEDTANGSEPFPVWIITVIAIVGFILTVVVSVSVVRYKQRKAAKVDLKEPLIETGQEHDDAAEDETGGCCGYRPDYRFAGAAGRAGMMVALF